MGDDYNFSVASSELHHLLTEVEKYKAYIEKQTDVENCLTKKDIINGGTLSFFGTEIFQFWLAAQRIGKPDKADFIQFAFSVNIPVRDRDLGPEGLSWLGRSIYAIWCESINLMEKQ